MTEHFVTECLTKESFFNQCADKNAIGKLYIDGWITFPKRTKIPFTYGVQCINTKYNPSDISMLQLLVTILIAGSVLLYNTGLLARCNCNNHYFYTGLVYMQEKAHIV